MRMAIVQKRFIGEFRDLTCVYFSILICFYMFYDTFYYYIKSFLIFKFSFETPIEKDSFLQIGSKYLHIALSFSYVSFCRRHYIQNASLPLCRKCTFIQCSRHRSQGSFWSFSPYSVLRGIVFSEPRDNRHYPDTLWFSAENKPTAVSAACQEYAT